MRTRQWHEDGKHAKHFVSGVALQQRFNILEKHSLPCPELDEVIGITLISRKYSCSEPVSLA